MMPYTSGSTGRPKGVVSTHAAMVFAAGAVQSQLRYRPDDVTRWLDSLDDGAA